MENYTDADIINNIRDNFYNIVYNKHATNIKKFLEIDINNNIDYYDQYYDILSVYDMNDREYIIYKLNDNLEEIVSKGINDIKEAIFVSYYKNNERINKTAIGNINNVVKFIDKIGLYNIDTIVHTHPLSFLPLPSIDDINGLKTLIENIINEYLDLVESSEKFLARYFIDKLTLLRYAIISPYFMKVLNKNEIQKYIGNVNIGDFKLLYVLYYGISFSIKWLSDKEIIDFINGNIGRKDIVANHKNEISWLYNLINLSNSNILDKGITEIISYSIILNRNIVYNTSRRIYLELTKMNTNVKDNALYVYNTENNFSCKNINMMEYFYAYPSLIEEYYCGRSIRPFSYLQNISIFPMPISNIPMFSRLK